MYPPPPWRAQVLALLLFLALGQVRVGLRGQTTALNSWTNPVSGAWEEMHWSLGILPAAGQAILITNQGWKAVAIGPATAQHYAQTLSPYSVTVSSPTNSRNTLLLNYAGYDAPLAVTDLVIANSASFTTLGSRTTVAGTFSVGGEFLQGSFSLVSGATLQLGALGAGTYNFTNGSLVLSNGAVIGGNFPARFNQFGGTNYPGSVQLYTGGEYDLYGGDLTTSNIISHASTGRINQHGGTVNSDRIVMASGTYSLDGGNLSSSFIELPGTTSMFDYPDFGYLVQRGGTNHCSLSIGNYRPPYSNASAFGGYTLSNGVLVTSSVGVGPYGSFAQYGGIHTSGGIGLVGDTVHFGSAGVASFTLAGGLLSARGEQLSIASFSQTEGTNEITGILSLGVSGFYGSSYNLTSGLLVTSNTIVTCPVYSANGFNQNGGTHIVSNLLTVSMPNPSSAAIQYQNGYVLSAGQLTSQNIEIDSGATFHHLGGSVVNPGLVILANGVWEENTAGQELGKLLLSVSQSVDSALILPAGSCVIHFQSSGSLTWSNQALLRIDHWNGLVNGGGAQQIYFGNDSGGLTPRQLAQMQFHGPNGSSGVYPARILATGEIVPDQFLSSQQTESGWSLLCPPGTVLQTATNVWGPYEDINETSNVHVVNRDSPQRFFRLRRTGSFSSFLYGAAE